MRRRSWKQLLGQHGPGFIKWARENQIRSGAFNRLAADLERYLLDTILVSPEACRAFACQLPAVLERCDEDIYDYPLVAPAYAYMHLLERYRRFWQVLVELTTACALPMGDGGISVLDVGTGPAPALYAVADFYDAVVRYSEAADIASLTTPPPRLETVEKSKCMVAFMHAFSELAERRGPFHATFLDFRGLDLPGEQEERLERETSQAADELDTSVEFARWWLHENERWWWNMFRYNLCIFSNFLTQASMVDQLRDEVTAVFRSIRPGGVVLVVGGTGDPYPELYKMVADIAHQSRARRVERIPASLPCEYGDDAAQRIKQLYGRVWRRLEDCCGDLTQIRESVPQDLWNPCRPLEGPREFGLRVFRKGR
jgi:hypothetical protein